MYLMLCNNHRIKSDTLHIFGAATRIVACRIHLRDDVMSHAMQSDTLHTSGVVATSYGVAAIRKLLKMIGLFCKRAL